MREQGLLRSAFCAISGVKICANFFKISLDKMRKVWYNKISGRLCANGPMNIYAFRCINIHFPKNDIPGSV